MFAGCVLCMTDPCVLCKMGECGVCIAFTSCVLCISGMCALFTPCLFALYKWFVCSICSMCELCVCSMCSMCKQHVGHVCNVWAASVQNFPMCEACEQHVQYVYVYIYPCLALLPSKAWGPRLLQCLPLTQNVLPTTIMWSICLWDKRTDRFHQKHTEVAAA